MILGGYQHNMHESRIGCVQVEYLKGHTVCAVCGESHYE